MSGPYLDPDEGRVRSLIRRSDGPVLIRPFRRERPRSSVLPVMAGAAALLVLGLAVGTSLAVRRQEVASPPVATGGVTAPTATPTHTPAATATPEPTPALPGVPVSAGAVPEAGVLFVQAADGEIYRYSGETGGIGLVARGLMTDETPHGVNVLTPDGRADGLEWDGGGSRDICGPGHVVAVSPWGVCAFQAPGDPLQVMVPRMRAVAVPAEWGDVDVTFDGSGSKLAVVRPMPGEDPESRAHNSLWVWDWEQGGALRKLYEPTSQAGHVARPAWSPDGRWITVLEVPMVSSSIMADGVKLVLIEVATGTATDLGTTVSGDWRVWSPAGDLAFIRGAGRETWRDKRLVVRTADGTEREVALPDASHVQLAPAWSSAGDLAFVIGPSGTDYSGYMEGVGVGDRRGMTLAANGSQREVRCPDGVVEGIRSSADGGSLLLLCRAPGTGSEPLSIWLLRNGIDPAVPLIRGLASHPQAAGFGFYGQQPNLNTLLAWSLAAR